MQGGDNYGTFYVRRHGHGCNGDLARGANSLLTDNNTDTDTKHIKPVKMGQQRLTSEDGNLQSSPTWSGVTERRCGEAVSPGRAGLDQRHITAS